MATTSWKEIVKRVSKNNPEYSEKEVNDQVKLYSKELRKAITRDERYEFDYFTLGVFTISIKKLNDYWYSFQNKPWTKFYKILERKKKQSRIIGKHGRINIKKKLVEFW